MFELPGYNIERQIGTGGMATVHLATQTAFKRKVAVKVLMQKYADDEEFAQRFLREAETVANLSHAHIISVYDFGQVDGTFYMVMEYLPGGDLMQWIKRGLEPEEALQITSDIASALHVAHEKGIVHRDVKPDNVMFREDNSAVLTDFGIARQKETNEQLTVAGAILGTPKYMSPEQLQGHHVDGRSDLYSLGIMFYEMLTRTAPYEDKEFMALAIKHIKSPIPQLPAPFAAYQTLFEHMVAKDPAQRFKHGLEIVKYIQGIRHGNVDTSQKNINVAVSQQVKQVEAPPQHQTDAEAKLAMLPLANKPVIKEGLASEETKTGLFKNKYVFKAQATAFDWARLGVILDTLSTRLLDWVSNRGPAAKRVEFLVVTRTENFPRVHAKINAWSESSCGKFLKKHGLHLTLRDINTGAEQTTKISW